MRIARPSFLLLLLCLPFFEGCAFGVGQVGPVGPLGRPEHPFGTMLGVGFKATNESFTGQRDSTWMPAFATVAEVAYNLPGNLVSVGAAYSNAASVDMDRDDGSLVGPKKVIWRGYATGPAAWLRLASAVNVEGKALRLHAHMDNADTYYPTTAGGDRVDMDGWRYEGDLNFLFRTRQGKLGVKLGWQMTKSDATDAWGASRVYESNGPQLVYWHNF